MQDKMGDKVRESTVHSLSQWWYFADVVVSDRDVGHGEPSARARQDDQALVTLRLGLA